jgi:hypothetical protein
VRQHGLRRLLDLATSKGFAFERTVLGEDGQLRACGGRACGGTGAGDEISNQDLPDSADR